MSEAQTMDLATARSMAYQSSAIELLDASAACDDVVLRDYLLGHAGVVGGSALVDAQTMCRWFDLEAALVRQRSYPLPENDPLGPCVTAWLIALMGLPLSEEQNWRLLLCAMSGCRTVDRLQVAMNTGLGVFCRPVDQCLVVGAQPLPYASWLTTGRLIVQRVARRWYMYAPGGPPISSDDIGHTVSFQVLPFLGTLLVLSVMEGAGLAMPRRVVQMFSSNQFVYSPSADEDPDREEPPRWIRLWHAR